MVDCDRLPGWPGLAWQPGHLREWWDGSGWQWMAMDGLAENRIGQDEVEWRWSLPADSHTRVTAQQSTAKHSKAQQSTAKHSNARQCTPYGAQHYATARRVLSTPPWTPSWTLGSIDTSCYELLHLFVLL
ncbi:hypothetical protein V8C37DRAFT_387731 [Trichoderma ceciliae]